METGQLREVKLKLGYFLFARWSPDGKELLTIGTDLRGRNNGLYRIDVHSGEATLIVGHGRHADHIRRTGEPTQNMCSIGAMQRSSSEIL